MDIDEFDPLSLTYNIIRNDENSRKFKDLLTRAHTTTNNEEARHLRTLAHTLVFREIHSQLDKAGSFY